MASNKRQGISSLWPASDNSAVSAACKTPATAPRSSFWLLQVLLRCPPLPVQNWNVVGAVGPPACYKLSHAKRKAVLQTNRASKQLCSFEKHLSLCPHSEGWLIRVSKTTFCSGIPLKRERPTPATLFFNPS